MRNKCGSVKLGDLNIIRGCLRCSEDAHVLQRAHACCKGAVYCKEGLCAPRGPMFYRETNFNSPYVLEKGSRPANNIHVLQKLTMSCKLWPLCGESSWPNPSSYVWWMGCVLQRGYYVLRRGLMCCKVAYLLQKSPYLPNPRYEILATPCICIYQTE